MERVLSLDPDDILTAGPTTRPRRLIIACHYPVVALVAYQRELVHKRLKNDGEVIRWLAGIGPHLYCCGHVHAAWALRPASPPNQVCLNAGAPLMTGSMGLRLPGFLEIDLDEDLLTVAHQAWTGSDWKVVPMLLGIPLSCLGKPSIAASPATP
ncbi:MAG: hypothetical protein ACP5XB_12000 [Isosphaeraceae bacterium]